MRASGPDAHPCSGLVAEAPLRAPKLFGCMTWASFTMDAATRPWSLVDAEEGAPNQSGLSDGGAEVLGAAAAFELLVVAILVFWKVCSGL